MHHCLQDPLPHQFLSLLRTCRPIELFYSIMFAIVRVIQVEFFVPGSRWDAFMILWWQVALHHQLFCLLAHQRPTPLVDTTKRVDCQPCTWEGKSLLCISILFEHSHWCCENFDVHSDRVTTLRWISVFERRRAMIPCWSRQWEAFDSWQSFARSSLFCFVTIRVDASVGKYCFSAASIRTYRDDTKPCLLRSSWHVLSIPFSCLYLSYARGLQLRHSML